MADQRSARFRAGLVLRALLAIGLGWLAFVASWDLWLYKVQGPDTFCLISDRSSQVGSHQDVKPGDVVPEYGSDFVCGRCDTRIRVRGRLFLDDEVSATLVDCS